MVLRFEGREQVHGLHLYEYHVQFGLEVLELQYVSSWRQKLTHSKLTQM